MTVIDIIGIGTSIGLFALLVTFGQNIRSALGDSIYNLFVFITVIFGIWGLSSFLSLIKFFFVGSPLFDIIVGTQYASLGIIFLILIAKLLNWF